MHLRRIATSTPPGGACAVARRRAAIMLRGARCGPAWNRRMSASINAAHARDIGAGGDLARRGSWRTLSRALRPRSATLPKAHERRRSAAAARICEQDGRIPQAAAQTSTALRFRRWRAGQRGSRPLLRSPPTWTRITFHSAAGVAK